MVANIRAPLYEEKVVDFLMELVSVTNQNVSREELFTDEDAPVAAAPETKKTKKSEAKTEAKAED